MATPLVKKLGIKAGHRVWLVNAPPDYLDTLGGLPELVILVSGPADELDFIQYFTKSAAELKVRFPELKATLATTGMLWISWPKKA